LTSLPETKAAEMHDYPILLDMRDRSCLVVGGGEVGTRKAESLLLCKARVTVVSLRVSARLAELARGGNLVVKARAYREPDLQGMFLVFGATDDPKVNRQVHADAERRGILCNIADQPEICSFFLPAVVRRGDLTISISTAGRSPALAKQLRRQLERQFGDEYRLLLLLLGAVRTNLLQKDHAPDAHKVVFEQLINSDILSWIRDGRLEEIDHLLRTLLGEELSFEALIGKLKAGPADSGNSAER
jgi:precorrin-2 dehydrogenase/sirohydrochlorin ferrochelatase